MRPAERRALRGRTADDSQTAATALDQHLALARLVRHLNQPIRGNLILTLAFEALFEGRGDIIGR
jgi:cobalamin biosynthesis protein CbiG